MTANVDCVIGENPHGRHCLTGGKPTNDKWCDGTPDPAELCKDKGGPEGVATPNPALDQHTYQTGRASRA
jgi:hypothetical protein